MHQVNNQLPFDIETPSDEELMARFRDEEAQRQALFRAGTPAEKNRRKRQRKAQRKARANNRAHA